MSNRKNRILAIAATAALALTISACGDGGDTSAEAPAETPAPAETEEPEEPAGEETAAPEGGAHLDILIGTSGDAETASVQAAVDAWSAATGHTATLRIATDLTQELSQGFAAGSPADVFYVSTELFPGWAENGSLLAFGDQLDATFYPALEASFTWDDTFFCAPKDFSTLALIINTQLWSDAGLEEGAWPTTWDELRSAAETLTADGVVGLSFGPEWQRVGTFMAQGGGGLRDAAGNADVDNDANATALEFVAGLLADGIAAFPSAIGTGWGGEAFGSGASAMTIEGNWIAGALNNDFPDTPWVAVELPAGPGGAMGTLQFTNCWGIAADSTQQEAAISFVNWMVQDAQQMQAARDFGVMPSVTTVADEWAAEFPQFAAFIRGGAYAQGMPAFQGVAAVISEFNAGIEGLTTGDIASLLSQVQGDLAAIQP
ncbi:MAG: extracellular solute-binding protein [Promicromonosporaceae bacterium]|nr:extracellular solute-binding protein [Promicromonosporaceae bacterium]